MILRAAKSGFGTESSEAAFLEKYDIIGMSGNLRLVGIGKEY